MKLYGPDQSPFAARVRIACRVKGLSPEQVPLPASELKWANFLALNPIGKVPVLLEGDTPIVESEVILEYIEDRFPEPALRPEGALERARMRTIIRVTDDYVMVPISRLFTQLDPSRREARVVEDEVARWRQGLGWLAGFVADAPYAFGDRLTLADCVLPPLCCSATSFPECSPWAISPVSILRSWAIGKRSWRTSQCARNSIE